MSVEIWQMWELWDDCWDGNTEAKGWTPVVARTVTMAAAVRIKVLLVSWGIPISIPIAAGIKTRLKIVTGGFKGRAGSRATCKLCTWRTLSQLKEDKEEFSVVFPPHLKGAKSDSGGVFLLSGRTFSQGSEVPQSDDGLETFTRPNTHWYCPVNNSGLKYDWSSIQDRNNWNHVLMKKKTSEIWPIFKLLRVGVRFEIYNSNRSPWWSLRSQNLKNLPKVSLEYLADLQNWFLKYDRAFLSLIH